LEYETILFEKEDGFCVITLNRPKLLNALNVKMWTELSHVVDVIDNDDKIKAFIFTGTPRPDGRPCFCAGADLKEMAGFTSGGVLDESAEEAPAHVTLTKPSGVKNFWALRQPKPTMTPTFEKITWSPKISIAAIDGVCTAGGHRACVGLRHRCRFGDGSDQRYTCEEPGVDRRRRRDG